jgi:hypothetical protein
MTNNSETDARNLVERISVQGFWDIFNHVYTAEDGFSLELFRGKTCLGSILSNDITSQSKARYQRFKPRNNDTILRINLGYRPLDIDCQLPMRDGWVYSYKGVMKIVVSNPSLFALQYQQESDPVALARLAIEDAIKRYAQRTMYDDINDNTLRYEARMALAQGTHKNYGLTVVEVLASNIFSDPKRAEMWEIKQQGMVENTRIDADAENAVKKAEHDAALESFTKSKQRQQDELQKQYIRQQAFLDAAAEGLKQKMLGEISEGVSVEILVRRYPQFASLLGFPAGGGALPGAAQWLPNPSSDNNSAANIVTGQVVISQSSPSIPLPASLQASSTPSSQQPFYSNRIGAWLVATPLSDKQRQAWKINYQIALMVSALDVDGIAEKGYMMPGDLIVEINDQRIQSAQSLLDTLDGSQAGTLLTVRVLRGGQPYDLELDIL